MIRVSLMTEFFDEHISKLSVPSHPCCRNKKPVVICRLVHESREYEAEPAGVFSFRSRLTSYDEVPRT